MRSWVVNIAFLLLSFAAVSCGPCKHMPSTQTNVKDSTVVRYKDSLRITDVTITRDSVVYVKVPVEQSIASLPAFRPSHLETSVAESDAYVDSAGLHHTLHNKKADLPVTVPVSEHHHAEQHVTYADSTSFHEADHQDTQYIEVEASLTWWQRFRLGAFWWLVAIALIGWRRELLWLIKKTIKPL